VQQARGGMGSRKHGISGTAPRFGRQKAEQQRMQARLEEEERQRRTRRVLKDCSSPIDAVRKFKPL
jgi:hypothetical protein